MSDQQTLDARALDEAIRRGYIVAHGPTSHAARGWRGWCRDGSCPCVIVHKPGPRARVELDTTPAGWRLTETGMVRVAAALARCRVTAERRDTAALRTAGVSLARAEDCAAALLRILADPASTEAV